MQRNVLPSLLIVLVFLSACDDRKDARKGMSPVEAIADIEKRILERPGDGSLFAERARLYERLDSVLPAMNDWKRAIALDSTNAQYHMAISDLFYRKVRLEDAEYHLRNAIRLAPSDTEPLLKLSELKLANREYIRAMELANQALRIDDQHARGYYLKGWIHMESGDTALAISSYRTAVERDPVFYESYVQLGVLHAALQEGIAWDYYNSALEVRPNGMEALYGKAMLAQDNHMDSLALALYAQIKMVDPRNPLPWYNTGYVLLEHQRKPLEARVEFSQAIDRFPMYAQAYYNRGLTYELENKLDSAMLDFQRTLEYDPDMELANQAIVRMRMKGVRF